MSVFASGAKSSGLCLVLPVMPAPVMPGRTAAGADANGHHAGPAPQRPGSSRPVGGYGQVILTMPRKQPDKVWGSRA